MNQIQQIVRGLNKNRLNTSVIVLSLAVGMSCFFLISIFIQREFKPESFNPDKNRTFALQCDDPFSGANTNAKMMHCRYGSAEFMHDNFEEVESYCRIWHNSGKRLEVNRNVYFDEPIVLTASSNFFHFFNYQLLSNNPETALQTQNDLVISEELAQKYFGESLPIGKAIKITFRNSEKEFFVSGVFKKPTQTTQIKFDMVTLIEERDSRCYLKLDNPNSKEKLEQDFERLKAEIPSINTGNPSQHYLSTMDDTYFNPMRRARFEASRDKADLWIAFVVVLVIMGIAVFNYLILLKNRLNNNGKAYTVKRIQGASNANLVHQVMKETGGMFFFSFLLGIVLTNILLPFFNQLLHTNITLANLIQTDSLFICITFLSFITIVTYLFALIHFKTQLKTSEIKGNANTQQLRLSTMSIIQLAASIILVICSTVIIKQIRFINNKEIGIDKNVVEVIIPPSYKNKTTVFKEILAENPNIKSLALASASPLLEHWIVIFNYKENGVEKEYHPCGFSGDENYVTSLGINILEGENFSGNPETDKRKCLINKSLADLFPDRNLVGSPMPGNEDKIIAGIVEDFHFSSLKRMIEPAYIDYNNSGPNILIKAADGKEKEVEASIAKAWNEIIPDYPQSFQRLDARYQVLHAENKEFIQLIGACCLISIFLSMMGLFAISMDKCLKRIKEIGVRKVNGARVIEILALLNKDFIKWVIIAFALATPTAWIITNKWLENFAYKTTLNWWVFALSGILALGIALLTVSWQSWKAATRNPVEALRYE